MEEADDDDDDDGVDNEVAMPPLLSSSPTNKYTTSGWTGWRVIKCSLKDDVDDGDDIEGVTAKDAVKALLVTVVKSFPARMFDDGNGGGVKTRNNFGRVFILR